MTEIKPIETIYKGYRFRSRLEARWAVFFDALDILYEYEKEGYELGEAGWYLPDFWLPQFKTWIEIKPNVAPGEETLEQIERASVKARALRNLTSYPVLICTGLPKDGIWCTLIASDLTDSSGGDSEWHATFAENMATGKPCLLVHDRKPNRLMCTSNFEVLDRIKTVGAAAKEWFPDGEYRFGLESYCDHIEEQEFFVHRTVDGQTTTFEAAIKARQARFEYGEQG